MINISYITIDDSNNNLKLEKFILKHYKNFNYTYIQKLIRTGQIRVNKKRVKLGTILYTGDILRLPIRNSLRLIENCFNNSSNILTNKEKDLIELLRTQILYLDDHLVAINKPAGIATQGGKGVKTSIDKLLPYIISNSNNSSLKIVHRLDKQTSGVLLLAKTNTGAKYIFSQFKEHKVQKVYRCIVQGKVENSKGIISANILKNNNINNKSCISDTGKNAITFYSVLDISNKMFFFKNSGDKSYISYLEIYPKTGRTHQIRVHLSQVLKTPIVGDVKYGYTPLILPFIVEKDELFLHAYSIKLVNLNNKEVFIKAPFNNKWESNIQKILE